MDHVSGRWIQRRWVWHPNVWLDYVHNETNEARQCTYIVYWIARWGVVYVCMYVWVCMYVHVPWGFVRYIPTYLPSYLLTYFPPSPPPSQSLHLDTFI